MEDQPGSRSRRLLLVRPSETGRPLVGTRTLMEKVERGKEDEFRILDGGQVELEDILSTEDPWVKKSRGMTQVLTNPSKCFSPILLLHLTFLETR